VTLAAQTALWPIPLGRFTPPLSAVRAQRLVERRLRMVEGAAELAVGQEFAGRVDNIVVVAGIP
jgi:hypothetical protein